TATTTGRNEGSRLIPTSAYHLILVILETKELVLLKLDQDPGLLQKSMKIQLNRLIVNPLMHFCKTNLHTVPPLVIIYGLDKCNNAEVQSRIIRTIGEILAVTYYSLAISHCKLARDGIGQNVISSINLQHDCSANTGLSLQPKRRYSDLS
ncbi:hypothetical protein BDQ17DRAFT_1496324, partial [Cyathus striatus]